LNRFSLGPIQQQLGLTFQADEFARHNFQFSTPSIENISQPCALQTTPLALSPPAKQDPRLQQGIRLKIFKYHFPSASAVASNSHDCFWLGQLKAEIKS
jgi:hypothetical protein